MPARPTLRRRSTAAAAFQRGVDAVAVMARASVLTSPKNPFFRRTKGKGLRVQVDAYERTRAVARAEERLLAEAWRKARVTKRDAGRLLVIDAASGKRYPSPLEVPRQRKVFLAKVDRIGRRRLYNPVDARTLARGIKPQKRALKVADMDWRPLAQAEPRRFREIMTEFAAKARRLPAGWRYSETTFAARTSRGEVDRVAERVRGLYRQAVTAQADHTQWQVEFNLLVRGVGSAIPLRLDPLRSYQFFRLAGSGRARRLEYANRNSARLLRGVVAYKLRDVIRRALAERGLVSSASARRIRNLTANEGKRRGRWRNAAGAPWAGAGKKEVVIEGLEFRLRRLL